MSIPARSVRWALPAFCVAFGAMLAYAADITDVNKALEAVSKENKPALVLFHVGKNLDKYEAVLKDADVAALLKDFVYAKVSVAGKKDVQTRYDLQEAKLPFFLVLGPGGLELGSYDQLGESKKPLDVKRFKTFLTKELKEYKTSLSRVLKGRVNELPTRIPQQQLITLAVVTDLKYKEAAPQITKTLADKSTPPNVRQACIRTLAACGDAACWAGVVPALLDPDRPTVVIATAELRKGGEGAAKALLAGLKSKEADLRFACANTLRAIYGNEPEAKSATVLKEGSDAEREAVVKALNEFVGKALEAKMKK